MLYCYFYILCKPYDTAIHKTRVLRNIRLELTSDTLLAIKTKSLTVKCLTYRVYSKYRKLRIETPCLTTETWQLILNDFVLK